MQILSYWMHNQHTKQSYESRFTESQCIGRPYFPFDKKGEYQGLSLIQAATLIEEWNKRGNKIDYFYTLHKPEISQ